MHRISYLVRLSPAKKYAIMAVTNTVVIIRATAVDTGIILIAARVQMTDPYPYIDLQNNEVRTLLGN
jgi:hypothetical protein